MKYRVFKRRYYSIDGQFKLKYLLKEKQITLEEYNIQCKQLCVKPRKIHQTIDHLIWLSILLEQHQLEREEFERAKRQCLK